MSNHKIEKKYSSAVKMLTLWSPWWLDYLSKTKRYYIPGSTQEFQGTSQMLLFAGEEFMLNKTPLEIAISLEYGLQQAVREVDRRARMTLLTNTNLDSEIVALAHSMEIFSDMEEKFNSISDSAWEGLVATNIHKDYIDFYDAKNRPYVPANAITCHDFNFEPGLSAESYVKLLAQLDRDQEQEWINAQDSKLKRGDDYEDIESDDKNSEKKSGESSSKSKKGTSGDNKDRDFDYEDDNYTPQSSNEDDEDSSVQDSSDNDNDDQTVDEKSSSQNSTQDNNPHEKGESPDISPEEKNDAKENNKQEEGGEYKNSENPENDQFRNNGEGSVDKDFQNGEDKGNMEEDSEIDPENPNSNISDDDSEEYNPDNSNTEDKYEKDIEKDQGNTNYSPETGGHGADGISMDDNQFGQEKNLDDLKDENGFDDFNDLLNPTEDSSSSQSGEERYVPLSRRIDYQAREQDTVSASLPEKPNEAQGLTNNEVEEATNALAEDVMEYEKNPQIPTLHVSSGSFTSWADVKTRKSKQSWKKLLPRILTSVSGKAAAAGLGDLSFSKRNPNQTDDMPLMMGFITYPPNVTILIDSSPSMQIHSKKTMSEFTALVGKFFARYGEPITVVVADSGIKDAFSAVSINANTKRAIKKTYHGSSANFGDTVEQILKKGASFRGRNFPKPDILVILTDCEFLWPMMEKSKLPGKYADVIVVSTNEYDSIKDILPKWVKEEKNFVYAI